jgi:hypothetical protein
MFEEEPTDILSEIGGSTVTVGIGIEGMEEPTGKEGARRTGGDVT